jgi:hypothetical protein
MKYSELTTRSYITRSEDASGVGEDSQLIKRHLEDLRIDYYRPISRQWASPLGRFNSLQTEWREATEILSSISDIAMHPSYQKIIGMGPTAIPMILISLSQELDHWFWALNSITGEDPVPTDSQGKIKEMANYWVEWGKSNYYL